MNCRHCPLITHPSCPMSFPRLVLNSLHCWKWTRMSDPPALTSCVPGLQTCCGHGRAPPCMAYAVLVVQPGLRVCQAITLPLQLVSSPELLKHRHQAMFPLPLGRILTSVWWWRSENGSTQCQLHLQGFRYNSYSFLKAEWEGKVVPKGLSVDITVCSPMLAQLSHLLQIQLQDILNNSFFG